MDRHFGNYILHERIGIGGMGEVFRATKHGPDGFKVQVALKVILPHLAREESFRRRFSREARMAASLKHPNIVHVNGFDIIDETPFIEMEYVSGVDLRRLLRPSAPGEKLSLQESVIILYAVARGLEHAHRHEIRDGVKGGIIHCDLNPHNILVSTLGEVKVTDFGIARAVHDDSAASATVRGKLAYMSPEQMEGRELDRRTDFFSFGIIAYQLLSGKHPFDRGSEGATIAAIGKAEHRPLPEAAPGLPPRLYDLVEQLLDLDPGHRPHSAAAVMKILEPLTVPSAAASLAGRIRTMVSETAGPEGSLTAPTRPRIMKSRLRLSLAMGAAAIILVVGMLFLPIPTGPRLAVAPEVMPGEAKPAASGPEPASFEHPVTIVSRPPGARILADGILIGKSPVVIRTGSGGSERSFEANLYGYRDESFQVPAEGVDRLVVTLAPLPTGIVRISARPWARVSFRGESKGETPVFIEDVPVGQHTFLLSYDPLGVEKKVVREVTEGMNTVSVDMREGQ